MLEKIKLKHNSPEWLEFRRFGIGGSDAAAILGKSPFKTNLDVWEEKSLGRKPADISEDAHVSYGKSAEDLLVRLFELDYPKYRVKVSKNNVYKRAFMFASLDGELTDKESGEDGILEIKTTEIYSSKDLWKWDRKIPEYYYIQILHYLIVTGKSFVVLKAQIKCLGKNGETELITRHFKFFRNNLMEDMKYLYLKEREFWEKYVLTKKRPPLILPSIEK